MDQNQEHPFAPFIRTLGRGRRGHRDLTHEEAHAAMAMILDGQVEPVQLGAFLMLMRLKEETPEEVAGMVAAARERLPTVPEAPTGALDWPSYAGKRRRPPWFILAQCLLADAGHPVLIHGRPGLDRDRCYTHEAYRRLGLPVAKDLDEAATLLASRGLCYLPLERIAPALDALFDLRPLLGLRSPVNTLARLLNPLGLPSIEGIFHPGFARIHQEAAALLGDTVAVFRGEGGEGEIRPDTETTVYLAQDGDTRTCPWPTLLSTRDARSANWSLADLCRLWHGADDPYGEAAVVSCTALGLFMAGAAPDPDEAVAQARALWTQRDPQRIPESPCP